MLGVCGSDVHQIDNSWGAASFPLVPGHEIIGNIVGIGPDVEGFTIGQRVGIGVQRSNCGDCDCCNNGAEQLCGKIHKTYAGPGKDKGGFAVHIRYTAKWTFVVPDSIPSDAAAPLLCAGITTFSPIKRHCKAGQKVGVIGIGGLGHLALQIASAMGCEVYAISRSEAKKEEALGFGATGYIASAIPEQFNAAKGSLDVIINTVSAVTGMDEYLSLLKPRGVMAYLGVPEKNEENKTKMFMHSIVPSEKTMVGSYLGPYDDYAEMFAFCAEHNIRPQIECVPLEEANVAIQKVRDNAARYRMVLVMPEAQ